MNLRLLIKRLFRRRRTFSIRRYLIISLLAILTGTIVILGILNYFELSGQPQQLHFFFHDVSVLVIMYLIIAAILLTVIQYGLDPLEKTAMDISKRRAGNLKPILVRQAPIEIQPVVAELNALFGRMNKSLEREKRFTANAAHELRTPLAALKTQMEVLVREKNSPKRQQMEAKLLSTINRCARLVDQLLTLSRLEPQERISAQESLNIVEHTRTYLADITPRALTKNIELSLEAPDNESLWIDSSPTAFRTMLRSVLDNALRHTLENGLITVQIQHTANEIEIQVIDNGNGIPAGEHQKIFRRFYRQTQLGDGSGLGLSIVKHVVRLHQGRIQAKDSVGHSGLTIVITLPKGQANAAN